MSPAPSRLEAGSVPRVTKAALFEVHGGRSEATWGHL